MRKQNYGTLSSKELNWKQNSKSKENIKKMKRREPKGKKKEQKEKRDRKDLLLSKMPRNQDLILLKEVHLNLKMIKRKNRKVRKLKKRLKKKQQRFRNSQKNPKRRIIKKIINKLINVGIIKNNIMKIKQTNKRIKNFQRLLKILNKIKKEK